MKIKIKTLDNKYDQIKIPTYAHEGDGGLDIYSAESCTIKANGGRKMIGTGICLEIPRNYAGFILSRSGLASNGIIVLNAPGLIDSGYRGEIKVILGNVDKDNDYNVSVGERIAQLVIKKIETCDLIKTNDIETETDRGRKGFGSSGKL